MLKLKLNGIYDQRIVDYLLANRVSDFSFDLRPKSFNFIQLKKIEEIIQNFDYSRFHISLQFENEKKMIIDHLLDQLKKFVSRDNLNQWTIELTGQEEREYLEQMEHPFTKLFTETKFEKIKPYLHLNYFRGLILDASHFLLMDKRLVFDFMGKVLAELKDHQTLDILIDDVREEQKPLLEDVLHFFPINKLSFSISKNLESSYREINWERFDYVLGQLSQEINQVNNSKLNS